MRRLTEKFHHETHFHFLLDLLPWATERGQWCQHQDIVRKKQFWFCTICLLLHEKSKMNAEKRMKCKISLTWWPLTWINCDTIRHYIMNFIHFINLCPFRSVCRCMFVQPVYKLLNTFINNLFPDNLLLLSCAAIEQLLCTCNRCSRSGKVWVRSSASFTSIETERLFILIIFTMWFTRIGNHQWRSNFLAINKYILRKIQIVFRSAQNVPLVLFYIMYFRLIAIDALTWKGWKGYVIHILVLYTIIYCTSQYNRYY